MAQDLVDDPTIPDDSLLLRRIPLQPNAFIIWDANEHSWRITSQAFKNSKRNPIAISVHLHAVLNELGLPIGSVIIDGSKYALAALPAGFARSQGQIVRREPEPNDPAHAHLIGDKPKSVQSALASAASWLVPPADWPWSSAD